MGELEDKIKEFFAEYNITPLVENARSYIFNCPSCGGERKFFMEKKSGKTVCFRKKNDTCPNNGSNVVYGLSLLSGLNYGEVKRYIYNSVAPIPDIIKIEFAEDKPVINVPIKTLNRIEVPLDTQLGQLSDEAMSYLASRGVPEIMQKEFQIMYSPSMRRIIFPVFQKNTIVGWQGRAIDDVDHRYRMYNAPGEWKASTLMFHDKFVGSESLVIAEGPFDALKFFYVAPFCATMGKNISETQIKLIAESGHSKIYLALDRDARNLIHGLRNKIQSLSDIKVYMVEVPDHRSDFGDCTLEECVEAVDSAKEITGDEIFIYI